MACSRFSSPILLWSLVLISFIVLKLRSTVIHPIQKAQESERGRGGERRKSREVTWEHLPLCLYLRIISSYFTGRQQHSLCHFYCNWERFFLGGGEEAGVFGGEASPPTSPSRLSLESVRQSGLCSPLATPPHEHNLRHCICHIVIRILYLPFPLWVASIYVDRVACHSVCWGGFSQARVNTSLLNWYTIKYYSWFCVGKYLQGTFTLGNTLQTSLAEGISLPTNLHL